MPLEPGSRLGGYEVVALLGAGGMGEVYRARDLELGREVAIKVLPDELAASEERLLRFEREARLLASLNHPNIATVHGFFHDRSTPLGAGGEVQFLVMEVVDGEDLAARLHRGPLPVDEALPYFRQVAEGLAAAHAKGVVHRDLKPANLKSTSTGTVKILDFGLAKGLVGDDEEESQLSSESPTLTQAVTRQGVILGTAAYMSPEQARGKRVDHRTDIWSFGCCLYEALTARRPFPGDDVTDTLARILERPPDFEALPADTPPSVRRLLRRCLVRDPEERLQHIGDARLELVEAEQEDALPSASAQSDRRRRWPAWVSAVAAVAGLFVGVWGGVSFLNAPATSDLSPVVHFTTAFPVGLWRTEHTPLVAISHDGRTFAAAIGSENQSRLYLRELGRREGRELPGTLTAESPFFSPDGEWLGFFVDRSVKKVSLRDGRVVELCTAPSPHYPVWGGDDFIYFTPSHSAGIVRVSASGGEPEAVTRLDESSNERAHYASSFLPGGELLVSIVHGDAADEADVVALLPRSGERRLITKDAQYATYSPSGHLVYAHAGDLRAAPFDVSTLETTGPAAVVLQGVRQMELGTPNFALSATGTLIFSPGDAYEEATRSRELVWVSRDGSSEPAGGGKGVYATPRLSPDGRMVAVQIGLELLVGDLQRGLSWRLVAPARASHPIWSPDGLRLAFASDEGGSFQIYLRNIDGSGQPITLTRGGQMTYPMNWSSEGSLVASEYGSTTATDIWIVDPKGEAPASPWLETPSHEFQASLSPDGHWLAYASTVSGRLEIYVRAFPGPGGEQKVSLEGGHEPVWSRDGSELYYRNGYQMMAVAVERGVGLRLGTPELLFEGPYARVSVLIANFDVAADGRFLMVRAEEEQEAARQLDVIVNWHQELLQLAGEGKGG